MNRRCSGNGLMLAGLIVLLIGLAVGLAAALRLPATGRRRWSAPHCSWSACCAGRSGRSLAEDRPPESEGVRSATVVARALLPWHGDRRVYRPATERLGLDSGRRPQPDRGGGHHRDHRTPGRPDRGHVPARARPFPRHHLPRDLDVDPGHATPPGRGRAHPLGRVDSAPAGRRGGGDGALLRAARARRSGALAGRRRVRAIDASAQCAAHGDDRDRDGPLRGAARSARRADARPAHPPARARAREQDGAGGAARDARVAPASALPLQHAERDLGADP